MFTNLWTRIAGHWQMTLAGIAGAGIVAVGEYLGTGQITWKGVVGAFVVAATGAFKKNFESWTQPKQ